MGTLINSLKWIVVVALLSLVMIAVAQDASSIPVHFAGRIERVENGLVVINQIVIDTHRAAVNTALDVGNVVVIDGFFQDDGTIVAVTISAYTPAQVRTAVPVLPISAAPTTIPILVPPAIPTTILPPAGSQVTQNSLLSGEIQAINQNVLTVNGQIVIVRADDPVLGALQVGDQVAITTQSANGLVTAVSLTRLELASSPGVVIEGMIQEMQGNTFSVNNLQLQFPSGSTLLQALRVGDRVRIEGSYTQSPAGLMLNITSLTLITRTNVSQNQADDEQGNSNGKGMGNGRGMGD